MSASIKPGEALALIRRYKAMGYTQAIVTPEFYAAAKRDERAEHMNSSYNQEAIPCLCPDCGEPAATDSEMCGGCEWLGCTDTRARHG